MSGLESLLRRIENTFMVVALLTAFVLAAAQVIMRYVFDTGEIWIEATVVDLTILAAMMGGSRAVAIRSHVRVGFFVDWLPRHVLRWINLLVIVISIAYCGFIFYASMLFVQFLQATGAVSVETGVPSWVEFSVTPIAMAFFIARYLLLIPDTWRGTLPTHDIVVD
jgi:C4-dicarboxylate transporter DctQ subunit